MTTEDKKIFELTPQHMQAGLMPDLPEGRSPLRDGRNLTFEGGAAKPAPGQFLLFTRSETGPVLGINSQLVGANHVLVWGNHQKLFLREELGAIQTVGTGYSLDALADKWSIVNWGNFTVAAYGSGKIQIRQGSGNFGNLTGSPDDVRILVRREPFLMGLNTSVDPRQYVWSDRDNIES